MTTMRTLQIARRCGETRILRVRHAAFVLVGTLLLVGCGSEPVDRDRPRVSQDEATAGRLDQDARANPPSKVNRPPKPGSEKGSVVSEADGRATAAIQEALDRLPAERRGKVVALMTCRAFSSRSPIPPEKRMEMFDRAAVEIGADASSVDRCMAGLRSPPKAARPSA